MADMDPELAFLEAQKQEYDPAADFSFAAEQAPQDEDEEYDPASAFANPEEETRSPSVQSAPMAESTANTPQPAADNALKPLPTETSTAPSPQKQPRTKGGFVDESEDDEDEEPVAKPGAGSALLNAPGAEELPKRSVTLSPSNHTHTPQAMPSISAQVQPAPAVQSPSVVVPDSFSSLAPAVSNGGTPVPDATKQGPVDHLKVAPTQTQASASATPVPASLPAARLPQDTAGRFEDRIKDDPRGDVEAWLGLIDEYRKRHKTDEARAVFERFFQVFPSAAEVWVQYVNMETELENFAQVEQIFSRSIQNTPSLLLYSSYIEYVRRRYPLEEGENRKVIVQAYEFVLEQVGIDISSGKLWTEYIEILKSGPGILGSDGWQDRQKMDILRKAYQRAIAVPTNATLEIWRNYNDFEIKLNKVQGRKHLQEKSATYMTARSAVSVAENLTRGVNRTTLPKLPPLPGFDGAEEFTKQVQAWKAWIEWEKSDPLEIKGNDRDSYNRRVLYLYKNALFALRFWPEMWFDAADWSHQNGLTDEGDAFLKNGMDANPESCLLAFKRSHHLELRTDFENGEPGVIEKGKVVREPFDKVLGALYELADKAKEREARNISIAQEAFNAVQQAEEATRAASDKGSDVEDDDEESSAAARRLKEKQDALKSQLQGISNAAEAEINCLKKTITYAWIALMRAMRRVQGKGVAKDGPVPGFRAVFNEARKRGKLLSDAYVVSALIEHHCYQDVAAGRIFERGMKLFPYDENFALEYIKHLVKLSDATNARAVFETSVTRLFEKQYITRAKPLFVFFHKYEAQYGELAQINKLEQRMATLFPEDPQLLRFASRFSATTSRATAFDPTATRPVISPRTQMRPAMPIGILHTVEEPLQVMPPIPAPQEQRLQSPALVNSPRLGHLLPATNSPKRPLEDADGDMNQPRKMIRGESPLKGAAGRRLDAARRNNAVGGGNTPVSGPTPLPKGVNFLLGIIPPAHTYEVTRLNPTAMVNLLRSITVPPPNGAPPAAGPPAAHIGAQLQNIQARYGPGNGFPL